MWQPPQTPETSANRPPESVSTNRSVITLGAIHSTALFVKITWAAQGVPILISDVVGKVLHS